MVRFSEGWMMVVVMVSEVFSPNEVFPTPGGPTRQMIVPLEFPLRNLTARNSKILFLTFSNPE